MNYNYIVRQYSKNSPSWVVRLLKHRSDSICKSFSDKFYGGKIKALNAAQIWRDNKIKTFTIETRLTLRNGYPRFRKDKGVYIVKKIKCSGDGYYYAYVAKCNNKFTGEISKKSFSYGNIRTKKQAFDLATEWRKKTVKKIERIAKIKGYRRI